MAIAWRTDANNLMVYIVSGQLGIQELNQAVQESSSLLVGGKCWIFVGRRDLYHA